jgi:hypothetical protein
MRFFNIFGGILTVFIFFLGYASFVEPDYEMIANGITAETAIKLEKQRNLRLAGTGGGMMNDIQMMAMGFDCCHEINLNESRELLLYAVDEYLSDINRNEDVRPYLHNYPFTEKNVEIRVWISKPDGTDPSLGNIYYISAIKGILRYSIPGKDKYSSKVICKETYEEAKQKINSESYKKQGGTLQGSSTICSEIDLASYK